MPTASDKPASVDEAIATGLAAVEAAARGLGTATAPAACRDIGRVFDTAIEHGAPIWNDGSHVGCARIYLRAARALLEELRDRAGVGRRKEVLGELATVAAAFPDAKPENADKLGWALRGVFDRFHRARGMEDVDLLIGATRAGGGAVDLDLIGLCLTVAIDHGNTLFQNKDIDGCAVLHHHTARRVLDLLAGLEQSGGRLTPALRSARGAGPDHRRLPPHHGCERQGGGVGAVRSVRGHHPASPGRPRPAAGG